MPPYPSFATVFSEARFAAGQARQQQIDGCGLGVGTTRRQPQDRGLPDPGEPEHRPRVRRDATPDDPAAERRRQAHGRLVLVQLACLGHEDGGRVAGIGRSEGQQVFGAQPATLRPTAARDRQVAREYGTHQARRDTAAGRDPFDPHAVTRWFAGGLAAERGLDRATGVDHRHARSIVAIRMDVAVDGLAIGRVFGGGGNRGR